MTVTDAKVSLGAPTSPTPDGLAARGEVLRPRAVRIIRALIGRDLRRFFRQPSRVVGSVAQPLILWIVLGAGFATSFKVPGANDVSYLAYFYPGTVVLTLLFTAIFSTMSVIEDRHHGFLQAVLAAPVSRLALVLGKTLGGVAIALCQTIVLVALAPLAGLTPDLSPVALGSLGLGLGLAAVGFTALGFAVAWWTDSTQGYHAIMSVALIPLWMLSGAMFPPSGHRVLEVLAAANPMTYAVAATRRGLHGTDAPLALLPPWSSAWLDLVLLAAFAILALAAAAALCRRRKA